jgi:predicted house-cleaning noncanonical NTP pyrophosphatase (MazG superfamily)
MALKKVKLIRDKLEPKGPITCQPVPSVAIHAALLVAKLHEEVGEVAEGLTDASEYADVLQALMDLARLSGVPWKQVETELDWKLGERGGFAGGKVMVVKGEAA